MSYHQVDANLNLPTTPSLLRNALPMEQLSAIHQLIGTEELTRLASVTHGGEVSDWNAVFEQEGRDLDVVCGAISKVTGKNRPWIIGFASEFASGLMEVCRTPGS